MPKATITSLYRISKDCQLLSLLQEKLSGTESSAELNDLIHQLQDVNSALNIQLQKIHLAVGTNHGEYDGHQSSPSAFVLPFFNSHAKDSVLEKKVAFCFFLFSLYHFSTNTNQSAILQEIISDALKEVFQYAKTRLTSEASSTDALKASLLTLFSMKLVTVKKTKTSRQETVLAGPPQSVNVIEIEYTKVEHVAQHNGALYHWITVNTEVFELFKEVAMLLGSERDHQFTWEFLTLSLRTYVLSLRKLKEDIDNPISAPIVTGLLALLGNAPIIMETTSKSGKVSQTLRHQELLTNPEYYEARNAKELYENYISKIFPMSAENPHINKIKIAFLEAILLNPNDPLVQFLSNSRKGIPYLCKLVADYSLLTYTKPENLNTFNPLTENDSLTTEDIMLERPISETLTKTLSEKYAKEGKNKNELCAEIICEKDLPKKISNIYKAIDPRANTLLSTVFYTPRGRFFAKTPSADNSRSQVSKLKAELPLTEKELAIAFFKEHKLPMPERLKRDFIELDFESADISEHLALEDEARKSTLQLSDIGQGTPASRESFVLKDRLSIWEKLTGKTSSLTDERHSITTTPQDLPSRPSQKNKS